MNSFFMNLFFALFAEGVTLLIRSLFKDKKKRNIVFIIGTSIAGFIAFHYQILSTLGNILPENLSQPIISYLRIEREVEFQNNKCNVWDLNNDFLTYPNQENPNRDSCGNERVWLFLRSTGNARNPDTYFLLNNFEPSAFGELGYEQWQGDHELNVINVKLPSIGLNTTTKSIVKTTATHPKEGVVVHPWKKDEEIELIIIGWRSPFSGVIDISGSIVDADPNGGDGILWFIDLNQTSLAYGGYVDGGSQTFAEGEGGQELTAIKVYKDDDVYFIVHPNQDDQYDTTLVNIKIVRR